MKDRLAHSGGDAPDGEWLSPCAMPHLLRPAYDSCRVMISFSFLLDFSRMSQSRLLARVRGAPLTSTSSSTASNGNGRRAFI